jgi:hypothetical protein
MSSSGNDPWYAPQGKRKTNDVRYPATGRKTNFFTHPMMLLAVSLLCALASGALGVYSVMYARTSGLNFGQFFIPGILSILLFVLSAYMALHQAGKIVLAFNPKSGHGNAVQLAIAFLKGEILLDDGKKGLPAPELALNQFVMQVRAYANEKIYQKTKLDHPGVSNSMPLHLVNEPVDLLKRRWNEVIDSLNEFEIYLANDPQGMIEKLVLKNPNQMIDTSQVFRDVAESFDTTWRRKGINIESAIVTPLKANTNEAVLRRVLVGPWRSSAYFARRGGGVIFTAKSVEGKVVARWESEGLMLPEEFLKFAQQSDRSVNERIEKGLELMTNDPNSPNTLHALISFITWIDLVKTAGIAHTFKHNNEGFVIEIRL